MSLRTVHYPHKSSETAPVGCVAWHRSDQCNATVQLLHQRTLTPGATTTPQQLATLVPGLASYSTGTASCASTSITALTVVDVRCRGQQRYLNLCRPPTSKYHRLVMVCMCGDSVPSAKAESVQASRCTALVVISLLLAVVGATVVRRSQTSMSGSGHYPFEQGR